MDVLRVKLLMSLDYDSTMFISLLNAQQTVTVNLTHKIQQQSQVCRIRDLTEFKPGTSNVFFFPPEVNMITDRRVNIVLLRNVMRFTLRVMRRSGSFTLF